MTVEVRNVGYMYLNSASLVYDRFHVMKLVNTDLNKLRKKMGIKDKYSKYLLLKNFVDLDEEQKKYLAQILQKSPRSENCLRTQRRV